MFFQKRISQKEDLNLVYPERIDEIWADNYAQGIRNKIQSLEFMGQPCFYNASVRTIFLNPRKKAVRKIRKHARKYNYKFIFYRHCENISGFSKFLFGGCNLNAILYRRILKHQKVLEDIEED